MAQIRTCKHCGGPIISPPNPELPEWVHVQRADSDRCSGVEAEPAKT